MSLPRLHPDDLAAIVEGTARRVVELMADAQPAAPTRLLTAAEVAARFGVERGWVYAHAEELGGVRLGGGPKARLRFDAALAAKRLTPRQASEGSPAPEPQPRRASPRRPAPTTPAECPLLPIRGGSS